MFIYRYPAIGCFLVFILMMFFTACNQKQKDQPTENVASIETTVIEEPKDTVIIDACMTLEEALTGTKAPESILNELVLLNVEYKSTDNKLHRGQIIVNKKIEDETRHMFQFMLDNDFTIEKVIPIVAYDWSDSLSMDDNNSSGFNYRNISYSKHATGMAIDINPRFNPLRWKNSNRPNQPAGAALDTTINGTLHPNHDVVKEFRKLGFRWGHTFSKYYDDHHFEMNR